MNYRDERDALRGRIEGLEQDLQEARQEQLDDAAKRERIEQIEARMRETEATMQAMRTELSALGGPPKAPRQNNKNVALFAGMGVTFLVAAVAAVFLVGAPAPPPPPVISGPHDDTTQAVPPIPPVPEIPATEAEQPPTPARQVNATWTGKITKVTGLAAAPGAPCIVDATLENAGAKQRVAHLSVKCADKVVFDSSDKLEGMSMNSAGMAEAPGKEAGTFAYAVGYTDQGTRNGPRTQITLDTTHGQGIVWSDAIPVFRVEFSVPELSAPVKGEALLPAKK